jgi:hypothetical protein
MEFKARDMPLDINKTIKSLFHREIGLLISTIIFGERKAFIKISKSTPFEIAISAIC